MKSKPLPDWLVLGHIIAFLGALLSKTSSCRMLRVPT